jgi:DNA-binding NarL/FixJ family response regulator
MINIIQSQGHSLQTTAPTLIVAAPGRIRQALGALLNAIPWVQIVAQTDNSASALMMVRRHCPKLVLLDANLSNNQAWTFLNQLKAEYPDIRSIVLVDYLHQHAVAHDIQATVTLLKGFPISELCVILEKLASGQTNRGYLKGEVI